MRKRLTRLFVLIVVAVGTLTTASCELLPLLSKAQRIGNLLIEGGYSLYRELETNIAEVVREATSFIEKFPDASLDGRREFLNLTVRNLVTDSDVLERPVTLVLGIRSQDVAVFGSTPPISFYLDDEWHQVEPGVSLDYEGEDGALKLDAPTYQELWFPVADFVGYALLQVHSWPQDDLVIAYGP